ncbi:hypothetical protein TcYC6_0015180 [Trypanosoma cruzi]|nr:hypothetical protein TcYC6_0015180 [Trypanosoma cruzi]
MLNPRRHPTLAQLTGTLTTGIVALAERIIVSDGSRQWLTAPPVAGDWETHVARTPPSLVGKRPHWPASAAGFRTNADGCYGHCKPLSRANAVGVRRGCRTGVVMHMVNAHGITRSQALRKFNFPGESERPGISPEPPPTT